MRVLFATAELAPIAVVGGLAFASAGLVAELRRQGVEVEVVLPDYGDVPLRDEAVDALDVAEWAGPARARRGTHSVAGRLTLVEAPGLARPHPYLQPDGDGWPDNDQRFLAFSQCVAALARSTRPDILHLNDWHTAAAAAALDAPPPTVLSIHNLAYQGWCEPAWLDRLGPRAAPYLVGDACNPLAGGLALADAIVAVSPTYAAEIRSPGHGRGLDELLESRSDRLVGILNGIDTHAWDPSADPHLPVPFDADSLAAKTQIRAVVRDRLGLAHGRSALVVMVTRLTVQKGLDLVLPLVPFLAGLPAQLVVLGAGELELALAFRAAAAEHPSEVVFVEGYDEALGHLLFAGGDILLMPSRFEPCGLTQMQAMRYGAIPVVTDVGGLHDTVVDADASPRSGTGFISPEAEVPFVLDALHRAVRAWRDTRRRSAIQRRGMTADWSWSEPAGRYVSLYERVGQARPLQRSDNSDAGRGTVLT